MTKIVDPTQMKFSAFDPSTMTFGAVNHKDGEHRGGVPLKMPTLQVGAKDALVRSTYGVNMSFAENGRAPLELLVDPVLEAAVRDFEAHVQKVFTDNARAWLKKDKQHFEFKSMLRATEAGVVLKTKVVVDGLRATGVKLLTPDGKMKREPGTLLSVNHGCEVVAYVQSSQLWYNTLDCTYGVALTAKALFVKPGDGPPPIDADALALDAGFEYE